MLIFYEKEYAEALLNGLKRNKQLTFHELCLVAIYLRDFVGKSKRQVYDDLIEFCKINNPDFNEILGMRKLKAAVDKTDVYGLRKKRDIAVTRSEIDVIQNSFSDYKHQKVLFIMVVVAKFFHNKDHYKKEVDEDSNKKYYVNQSLSKICKLAKVHIRRKERYKILYEIQQAGLIEATLRGTFEIRFIDDDSPTEVLVTDLNNIESFFPYYCSVCNKKYKRAPYSKNQMCDDCYEEKRREDERIRMQKARKN